VLCRRTRSFGVFLIARIYRSTQEFVLQFNVANPSAGAMKVYDIDDEKKLAHVFGLRMGHEIEGEKLGEEFSGYVFRYAPSFCAPCGVLHTTRSRNILNAASLAETISRASLCSKVS
jgi:hypothetical protein